MGAIFGVFDPRGFGLPDGVMERLSRALAHRGDDASGAWIGDHCGLGFRLRHTTPESLLELPPSAANDGLVLACDARIDNREELTDLLGIAGANRPDSDFILAGYRRWGRDCVQHLVGDFAFAIFDPARDEVFCARDHFGVRPFVYTQHQGVVGFASEARALVAAGVGDATPDEERIADFLLRRLDDKIATFHCGVRRLPPAHCLRIGRHGVETWRYWQPDPATPEVSISDADAAQRFRELFVEAVRCRTRSAFPVGAFLSGGLDSSSVTMVAARLLARPGHPLPVFSAVFPSVPDSDESDWMARVAAAADAEGHPLARHDFLADQAGPLESLDEMARALDGPSSAVNLYQPWAMLAQARQAGVRVMLTGHDGDTVVSHGLAHLTELAVEGEWDAVGREIAAVAEGLENYGSVRPMLVKTYVRPSVALLMRDGRPFRALLAIREIHRRFGVSRRALLQTVPGLGWLGAGRAGRDASGPAALAVNPVFWGRPAARRARTAPPAIPPASARQDHVRALDSGLITAAFEEFDQISATRGIESRHPFFDKRLVDFCLSLPLGHKLREGWSRVVQRNAMAGILPEAVRLRRDKSNLGHNFVVSLVAGRAGLERRLEAKPGLLSRYWDQPALQAAADRYAAAPTARGALLLYLAAAFEAWSRHRPDGGPGAA